MKLMNTKSLQNAINVTTKHYETLRTTKKCDKLNERHSGSDIGRDVDHQQNKKKNMRTRTQSSLHHKCHVHNRNVT